MTYPVVGLKLYPDIILSKVAEPVTEFNNELDKVVMEMMKLMNLAEGAGLAGPQAGISKRIVVWKVEDREGFWINPELIWKSEEKQTLQEGCLSFPRLLLGITRSESVTVKYQDTSGNFQEEVLTGAMAQMAQHEVDHLDGILFIKYMSPIKRDIIERKSKKYKKQVMKIRKEYEKQARKLGREPTVKQPDSGEYDFSIPTESV